MGRLKGAGIVTLAVVACPCHLPILLGVLGGTAIGAALAANFLTAFALFAAVFIGAGVVGLRALEAGSGRTCARYGARRTP
jgi:mercuric ion transport protein